MRMQECRVIDFSGGGDEADPALDGWAAPEAGRRWAAGARSCVTLTKPEVVGALVLLLTVEPFLCPPILTRQRFTVFVNGSKLRSMELRYRTTITCRIEPEMLGDHDSIELTFDHPDMVRPDMVSDSTDSNHYSVAFVRIALLQAPIPVAAPMPAARPERAPVMVLPRANELSDAALLEHFASLGDNCEFGFVQRQAGCEPADLLRFAGVKYPSLLKGMESGFEGIDDYNELEIHTYVADGVREYVSHVQRYDFQSHTGVYEDSLPVLKLIGRELKRLQVLRRLLLNDLAEANRIFVYKRNDLKNISDFMPLFERLRIFGPVTLLVVVLADPAHPPGTVEFIRDGLLKAYIDRLNPYDNAMRTPSQVWLEICRKTYAWWREKRSAGQRELKVA